MLDHLDAQSNDVSCGAIRRPSAVVRRVRSRLSRAAMGGPSSAVRARMPRGRRWILRSNTNTEDLPGLSSAGLYDSVVSGRAPDDAELRRALREVGEQPRAAARTARRAYRLALASSAAGLLPGRRAATPSPDSSTFAERQAHTGQ